ncbi:MAG: 3-methylcrotonyl-CoA carboxylase [Phototrophicales bacterium]|nr:MAG: 3-methylcrotonyl-CoA carboxylase [Phototrophicales bacterium]RMG75214.1 MAG: acetyl/propionyl/methylcrotonyl-CoA carboxylase subunit alpha [Chloroflexota bacterium]
MIRKILIANRGEIACRITRTCHAMGIRVVAVYSDADANALHVELADEAVHIGASPATESYLNIEKLLQAAQRTGADAVHPGYGFLAENPTFAQAVIDAGLTWIGPPPAAIEAMGKKREAKLMLQGVPLVPGYSGEAQDDDTLLAAVDEIGYPIMVKASAGGGGKGMRRVDSADAMPAALEIARREAKQAFGDDTLILEKLIENPRHIEIQIFGDHHGNVIALWERECSIQRRHQKIIEETPSTALDDDLRRRMCDVAVSIGQQLGYVNAGTVEFLLDADKQFYFMEMNTRLQVEHPVTEMITGLDLVRWQIAVAEGNPLPNVEIGRLGHAIEARVYAEDPANDFLPVIGDVLHYSEPDSDVRFDSGIRSGDRISTYYDPMIAKVIAWAETRDEAIRRLDYALSQTRLLGLRHNISFLRRVLTHKRHLSGDISTAFLDQHPELMVTDETPPPVAWIAAAIAKGGTQGYWRNNAFRPVKHTFIYADESCEIFLTPARDDTYLARMNDVEYHVHIISCKDRYWTIVLDGLRQVVLVVMQQDDVWVHVDGQAYKLTWQTPLPVPGEGVAAEGSLRAPMPGQVIRVNVEVGQEVQQGDVLMALEAMKMEHRILAPYHGRVDKIYFQVGDTVQADVVLLEIHAEE